MKKIFGYPQSLTPSPTHYCPGCTHGTIHRMVAESLDELGLPTGYIEGPNFGEPTSPDDYPQWQPGRNGLRTIQFAMGFRF